MILKTDYWTEFERIFALDERLLAQECGWLLGQVSARVEQARRAILPPAVAAEIREAERLRGLSALAALADNTLGEDALRRLLAGELTVPPSREYLRQELVNLLRAERAIASDVPSASDALATGALLELHATLLRDLRVSGEEQPGAFRQQERAFHGWRAAPAAEIPRMLAALFAWLGELRASLRDSFADDAAFVCALLAHRHLLWIRPFSSGNGAVARLSEQSLLRQAGVPAAIASLLPQHYQLTRRAYQAQIIRPPVSQDADGALAFLRYALQGWLDGWANYSTASPNRTYLSTGRDISIYISEIKHGHLMSAYSH